MTQLISILLTKVSKGIVKTFDRYFEKKIEVATTNRNGDLRVEATITGQKDKRMVTSLATHRLIFK